MAVTMRIPHLGSAATPRHALAGMTQIEALAKLAEATGTVRVTEARDQLLAAGLAGGNPRHLVAHLYHIMADRPDIFERIAPGVFRMIAPLPPPRRRPRFKGPPRYEYRVERFRVYPEDIVASLNAIGGQGWRLCNLTCDDSYWWTGVFEREVP